MKNSLIFFFLFLVFVPSCKKRDTNVEPKIYLGVAIPKKPYTGEATALRNGQPWTAKVYAREYIPDSIPEARYGFSLHTHLISEGDTFVKELLMFSPIKFGTFQAKLEPGIKFDSITRWPLESYFPPNQEMVTYEHYEFDYSGSFYLCYDCDNSIRLTSYDPATRKFEGEFQATFLLQKADHSFDTTRFENGHFQGRVYEIGPPPY